MTMVLEYPFKLFILIVVVIVIVGIMYQFRDWIMDICLFPPCNGGEKCNVQPVISTESEFSKGVLDKYCRSCWIKNGGGTCIGNSDCYLLNLEDEDFDPDDWKLVYKFNEGEGSFSCFITCENKASSLYVKYQSEGEGFIEIAC